MNLDFDSIEKELKRALDEIFQVSDIKKGDIFVVGCSTSEVEGVKIGQGSSMEVAKVIFDTIYPYLKEKGVYLAAQCCEHLNRAIIMEREALKPWEEIVNVVPQLHAGSAFATTAYSRFDDPVAVETVKASAGMDIGDTLIGMHLKVVAVPLRIKTKSIGNAHLCCARTRPKYIGGERAVYDEKLSGGEIRR